MGLPLCITNVNTVVFKSCAQYLMGLATMPDWIGPAGSYPVV